MVAAPQMQAVDFEVCHGDQEIRQYGRPSKLMFADKGLDGMNFLRGRHNFLLIVCDKFVGRDRALSIIAWKC